MEAPIISADTFLKSFHTEKASFSNLKHEPDDEDEDDDLDDEDEELDEESGDGLGDGDGTGPDEPDVDDNIVIEKLDTRPFKVEEMTPEIKFKPENEQPEKKQKREESDDGSEEDESVIRCPCKNNIDYGLMIQCETCDVWQHSICVGIRNQTDVPKHYYCELCSPRTFNCVCNKVIIF